MRLVGHFTDGSHHSELDAQAEGHIAGNQELTAQYLNCGCSVSFLYLSQFGADSVIRLKLHIRKGSHPAAEYAALQL